MTDALPEPLTPADCDLRSFVYMPVDIIRLFSSEFHAKATDAEWRAGFTLWLKSYHQVPAGSIPDDDVILARMAELGRDVDEFAFRLNDGNVKRHTMERLESFVSGTKGKRLTYKALIQ